MSTYKLLTSEIDPYKCSIEDLKKEINKMTSIKEEYFNVEQAIKIYINSCYGACASPFFECYNVNVAEATTLQGQDMIRFTQKIIDEYFLEIWPNDTAIHEKIGISNVKPLNVGSCLVYGDTDSSSSSSICYENNDKMTIEDLYNKHVKLNPRIDITKNGAEVLYVNNNATTKTFKDNKIVDRPIKYIMRHKVSKAKWRLKSSTGKEVIVTNDHSLMVMRNNELIEIKPLQVLKTDKLVCIK